MRKMLLLNFTSYVKMFSHKILHITRCDECLMKVHPECEDFDCSVCRETAAVVEARLVSSSNNPSLYMFRSYL